MTLLKVPVGDNDHVQGRADAPLTLVEYGDYQCPYCGMAYLQVKRVQRHFGEKLRFVFRNFPLTESHPEAERAAETAEFAGAHRKFWEMHDRLYENQQALGVELYLALAEEFGLAQRDLKQALETAAYRERIRADFLGGVRSGVNGTPAFYINGLRHDAAFDHDVLVAALNAALKS